MNNFSVVAFGLMVIAIMLVGGSIISAIIEKPTQSILFGFFGFWTIVVAMAVASYNKAK